MLTAVCILLFTLSSLQMGRTQKRKTVFIISLVGDVCIHSSLCIVCIIVMYLHKPAHSNMVSVACIVQVCTSLNIEGAMDFIINPQKSSSIKLISSWCVAVRYCIQSEHKFFLWLQIFITRKLPGHVGTVRCTSEEFQPWIFFQQDGAPPHWGSDVRQFLDATFPNRWTGRDGPTPWPPRSPDITPLDFFLWGYVKDKVFSTPVPDITNLKARNNRHLYYNNWRNVGQHVERNWLSIRRSPCNKRSTCWSVLMCYKQTSWVELHLKKKVCIPCSFLVINVCNQGKNLCSPCIMFWIGLQQLWLVLFFLFPGLFSGQGLPIARVSKQLNFYKVRMSVSHVFMLLLMRIFHQSL